MSSSDCPAAQWTYSTAASPCRYAHNNCPGQLFTDSATHYLDSNDVPEVLRSCGCILSYDQYQGIAAAVPADTVPTVIYNNHHGAMLQLLPQPSICGSSYAYGRHVGPSFKPVGAPCCEQHKFSASCDSASTSGAFDASLDLECTEVLQDALDLQLVSNSSTNQGIDAPTASYSRVGHQLTSRSKYMASDAGDCGMTVPRQAADHDWDHTDGLLQLHNNFVAAAPTCEAGDSKQRGQQSRPAAGSASIRRRLLITELSLYQGISCNSNAALAQANKVMAGIALPDGVIYLAVHEDSFLFKVASPWQFPAFVVCLGSSYFQRMMARLPQLAEAVMSCPGFEEYAQQYRAAREGHTPSPPLPPKLHGAAAVSSIATLRSIQLTCLFLATKVADQVHALELLRFMLSQVSRSGHVVGQQEAADVELRCLDALDWRLGPYFDGHETVSDDLLLWTS